MVKTHNRFRSVSGVTGAPCERSGCDMAETVFGYWKECCTRRKKGEKWCTIDPRGCAYFISLSACLTLTHGTIRVPFMEGVDWKES
jgi:hypothetical protein